MGIELPSLKDDRYLGTTVYLLGAGCSVDRGLPTMVDFMRQARENERGDGCGLSEDYAALLQFRRDCMKIAYVMDRWWENMEDLFTQAHLRELTGDKKAKQLQSSMKRVIWDVYRRFGTHRGFSGYDIFSAFLSERVHEYHEGLAPRPVVVTTNYDVLLELELTKTEREVRADGRSRRVGVVYPGTANGLGILRTDECGVQDGEAPTEKTVFMEVLKLHGSVNWFAKSDATARRPKGRDLVVPDSPAFHPYFRKAVVGFECQDLEYAWKVANRELFPVIVPPLLGKTCDGGMIAHTWERAVKAFSCAREVYIIGYSFPLTDTFMTRLIAEGIRENEQLERIAIINKEKRDDWWKQVEATFARSWWRQSVDRYEATFKDAAKAMLLENYPVYQGQFMDPESDEEFICPRLNNYRRSE